MNIASGKNITGPMSGRCWRSCQPETRHRPDVWMLIGVFVGPHHGSGNCCRTDWAQFSRRLTLQESWSHLCRVHCSVLATRARYILPMLSPLPWGGPGLLYRGVQWLFSPKGRFCFEMANVYQEIADCNLAMADSLLELADWYFTMADLVLEFSDLHFFLLFFILKIGRSVFQKSRFCFWNGR